MYKVPLLLYCEIIWEEVYWGKFYWQGIAAVSYDDSIYLHLLVQFWGIRSNAEQVAFNRGDAITVQCLWYLL